MGNQHRLQYRKVMYMTKNYYSVRVTDPNKCSIHYGTIDVGRKGGMLMTTCIPEIVADRITGSRPNKRDWRNYAIIQRYLIPKKNAEPCGFTLCGTTMRGKREVRSLENKKCSRVQGRMQRCKKIVKILDAEPEVYRLVSI